MIRPSAIFEACLPQVSREKSEKCAKLVSVAMLNFQRSLWIL